ncbi:MAG: SMP-30/gluconolactonase/LRE family protein [Saprospiraceae bacterium]|nr:SMP-30/gluconolactonase/LRE family protein [Saprospiraceae bacterium]
MIKFTSTIIFGILFCPLLTAQIVTTISGTGTTIDDDIIQDASGILYGSNYVGDSVFKIYPDGTEEIFTSGINTPNGLAFDPNGNLLVVDNQGNKIYRVFPDGTKEIFVSPIAGPSGILQEYDSDTLIVTSYTTDVVWKIAPDGSVSEFLTHPEFNGPVGLCYDEAHNLYVANYTDRKIFKVTPDGEISFLVQINLGTNVGFITYAHDYIYATTMNGMRIFRVDLEGNSEIWLGSSQGNTDGDASQAKFNWPNGIRPSVTGDTLFVSDFGSKKVRMITDLDGTSTSVKGKAQQKTDVLVTPNPAVSEFQITMDLPTDTEVDIVLYDSMGRQVAHLLETKKLPAGKVVLPFSREDLPAGSYLIQLSFDQLRVQVEPLILLY